MLATATPEANMDEVIHAEVPIWLSAVWLAVTCPVTLGKVFLMTALSNRM